LNNLQETLSPGANTGHGGHGTAVVAALPMGFFSYGELTYEEVRDDRTD
jgi:hypothetical protein